MALATRCPNCQAVFRVVSDQLKLRGGLVRCGNCRHVFDAIGSLSYIEEAAMNAAPPAPTPAADTPAAAAEPVGARPVSDPTSVDRLVESQARDAAREATPARAPAPAGLKTIPASTAASAGARVPDAIGGMTPVDVPGDSTPPDPLSVPTLLAPRPDEASTAPMAADEAADTGLRPGIDFAPAAEGTTGTDAATADSGRNAAAAPATGARADAVTDDAAPRSKPRRRTDRATDDDGAAAAEDGTEAVSFLKDTRPSRGFSIFYGGGSLVLALCLLLQAAVLFRTELLTRWPELRPRLVEVCELYGCSVGWPTRADLLAVVGTELQAVPGTDLLELTAVVRNRASFRVALPAVEVTLTDTTNRTLARKVFAPIDYLASSGEPSSRINEGIGAGSDYIVRITFEARGLSAAGFVVYPFYL